MDTHKLPKSRDGKELGSSQCFTAVKEHLLRNTNITATELKPVQIALNNKNHFMSIQTLHAYVHERFVFPNKRLLNETWDAYEPFVTAILA
jgi:hypothetical protein